MMHRSYPVYVDWESDIGSGIEYMEELVKSNIWEHLTSFYSIKDPNKLDDIIQFIKDNPSVMKILMDAPEKIREIFGNVSLQIDLAHDVEENARMLVIVIEVSGFSVEEVMNLDRKLFDSWISDWFDSLGDKILITESFS